MYNTRLAPTAGKEESPFTVIYWKSYCNSLLWEWKCVCQRSDSKSTSLLSTHDGINNYNTTDDGDELKTPPANNSPPELLISSVADSKD